MLRVRVASSGWAGGPGLNTFYFLTGGDDLAAATDCAAHVHSAIATSVRCWARYTNLDMVADVDVVTPSSGEITDTFTTPFLSQVSSTDPGDTTTAVVVCGLLRFTTADWINSHHVKGRAFISPIPATSVGSSGGISAGGLTLLNTLATNLKTVTTGGATLAVWHRPVNGVGGQACIVTGASVATKLSELRSRRD